MELRDRCFDQIEMGHERSGGRGVGKDRRENETSVT